VRTNDLYIASAFPDASSPVRERRLNFVQRILTFSIPFPGLSMEKEKDGGREREM
jgi:hypothetical protein